MKFLQGTRLIILIAVVGAVVVAAGVFIFYPRQAEIEGIAVIEYAPEDAITPEISVQFDASASDLGLPEDQIAEVEYEWNFDDGSSGSGENAIHQYAAAGTYDVQLEVKVFDTAGKYYQYKAQTEIEVVLPDPPAVIATADYVVAEPIIIPNENRDDPKKIFSGDKVLFEADAPACAQNATCQYVWTFYDENGVYKDETTSPTASIFYQEFNPPQEYQTTLRIELTDQYGRTVYSEPINLEVPVSNVQPAAKMEISIDVPGRPYVMGDPVQPGQKLYFDASETIDPEGGPIYIWWDFDGDGVKSPAEEAWDNKPEAILEVTETTSDRVNVFFRDQYMLDHAEAPVTEFVNLGSVITETPWCPPICPPNGTTPPLPFISSGGIGLIGQLKLWNIDFGMPIPMAPNLVSMVGFGMNIDTVVINRTLLFPDVRRIYRLANVTTVIDSALFFASNTYYRASGNLFMGGGLGYLTMRGVHMSDHPRVLIRGFRSVPFTQSNIVLTFGVAYRLGFALFTFRVAYPL